MRTYKISALKALDHLHICRLEETFATRDRALHKQFHSISHFHCVYKTPPDLIMEYAELGMLGEWLISKAGFAAAASPLCCECIYPLSRLV